MTEENNPQEKNPIKWVPAADGVFETYANQLHLTWSLDDVRLRFAQIGAGKDGRTPGEPLVSVNVEKAAVTISWRNAKVLLTSLAQLISNYEQVNGEIKLQPTLAPSDGT